MRMSGYGAGFYDFDNDGWKDLFVTRGHVESMPLPGEEIDQYNTVFHNSGASGKWLALTAEAGLTAAPGGAASGLRVRRPRRRRPRRCGCDSAWRRRGDLDESKQELQPLAGHRPARDKEQSRRHRRKNQSGDQKRHAVQPHDNKRLLCVLQRRAGSFRTGPDARADRWRSGGRPGRVQTFKDVSADQILKAVEPPN